MTQVGTLVVFVSGLSKVADPWDQLVNFYRSVSNTAIAYDMISDQIKTHRRAHAVRNEDSYAETCIYRLANDRSNGNFYLCNFFGQRPADEGLLAPVCVASKQSMMIAITATSHR